MLISSFLVIACHKERAEHPQNSYQAGHIVDKNTVTRHLRDISYGLYVWCNCQII